MSLTPSAFMVADRCAERKSRSPASPPGGRNAGVGKIRRPVEQFVSRRGYNHQMAKILIVDDNADEIRALSRLLEHSGHKVVAATNGREALALAFREPPDVILLDLLMPEMDG